MREIHVIELMEMTSREHCHLARRINWDLPTWPEGSPERRKTLINLRNIRYVLKPRDFAP